jgi:hypothetical protein
VSYETVVAIGGDMIVRISPEDRHFFPLGMEWKENSGRGGKVILEAPADAHALHDHGLTLHWTHDDWRLAKIHAEHGWKQIGVGKEGRYYAVILKETK